MVCFVIVVLFTMAKLECLHPDLHCGIFSSPLAKIAPGYREKSGVKSLGLPQKGLKSRKLLLSKFVNFVKSVLTPVYAAIAAAWVSVWGRLRRSPLLLVVALSTLLLSGCVRYDVGIHFDSQTHGEIVQDITLSQRFVNLSSTTVDRWTQSLKQRARSLQGYSKPLSDRRWRVVIPFNNGDDLVEKFESFFNPVEQNGLTPEQAGEIPELETHLSLNQKNLIFAIANHLSLDVDLRALGVLSSEGNVLISRCSVSPDHPLGGQHQLSCRDQCTHSGR